MSNELNLPPAYQELGRELRPQLVRRLVELQARTSAVTRDLRALHDDDWTERAVEIENDSVLEGLDTASRTEAGLVLRALRRIDNGTYGTCAFCGRPIDLQRLRIVPAAAACRDCAAAGRR